MAESPLMTVQEMAQLLRCSRRKVRQMCKDGQLPGIKIGRGWRIDTSGTITARSENMRGEHPVSGRVR